MPIYAYKCSSCGHELDVLQKLSAAPLTMCPQCQAETFSKQLTAAGFQLKGSGWYATDFKNGSGARTADKAASEPKGTDAGARTADKAASEPKGTDAGAKTQKKETATASTGGSCGHGGCSACS
jgi:putative FmdB family regulatory protein